MKYEHDLYDLILTRIIDLVDGHAEHVTDAKCVWDASSCHYLFFTYVVDDHNMNDVSGLCLGVDEQEML